jgi:hypothetical protein
VLCLLCGRHTDYVRALAENFGSTLADAQSPLFRKRGKARVPTKGWLKSPPGNLGELMLSRPDESVPKMATMSRQRLVSDISRLPWLRFYLLFLSCKANARASFRKGHGPPPRIIYSLNQNDPPPPQIVEIFSQSDAIPLGSTPRHPSNQSSFCEGHCLTSSCSRQWQWALVLTCQGH